MLKLNTRSAASICGCLAAVLILALAYGILSLIQLGDWRPAMAGVLAALALIAYVVATLTVKSDSGSESILTGSCRGLLLGLNAVLNSVLLWWLLSGLMGMAALIPAGTIGLINSLACIGQVSRSRIYKSLLGWGNWLMPMSWLVVALGILFTLVSVLLHLLITLPTGSDFARIGIKTGPLAGKRFTVDWPTGTLFVHGGLVANLNRLKTAFNMGNFAFVHYKAKASSTRHEVGHTLNLAAFGSVFHLIGALDEVFGGHRAFAEYLADSNDPAGHTQLMMW